MTNPSDTEGERRSRRGILLWAAVAALIVVVAIWLFTPRRQGPPEEEGRPPEVAPVPEGSRSITLFFATADAEGLTTEYREVAVSRDIVDQLTAVLRELLEGPTEDGSVSCLPVGTRIREVFYDEERGIVYVDFNRKLVGGHPGGSTGEYYTIASVVKTLGTNFPEVNGVQFLVEGLEIESLAGHLAADGPFWVDDWR
jgi:spore germination protein GerM